MQLFLCDAPRVQLLRVNTDTADVGVLHSLRSYGDRAPYVGQLEGNNHNNGDIIAVKMSVFQP